MDAHKVLTVARKAGLAGLGAVAAAVAAGVLPSPWQEIGVAAVAIATWLGVYRVPNKGA